MPSTSENLHLQAHPSGPAVVPKKRRRRNAATGAANDCFACQKRGTKCDRRRPYCTPCLEFGKDCSGYKTQLTWGVGIASRGKLRGLPSPVAQRTSSSKAETSRRSSPAKSATSTPDLSSSATTFEDALSAGHPSPSANSISYDFIPSQHSPLPLSPQQRLLPQHTPDWRIPSPATSTPLSGLNDNPNEDFSHIKILGAAYEVDHPYSELAQLQSLGYNSLTQSSLEHAAQYAASSFGSAYSDCTSDFGSPLEYPMSPQQPLPMFQPLPPPSLQQVQQQQQQHLQVQHQHQHQGQPQPQHHQQFQLYTHPPHPQQQPRPTSLYSNTNRGPTSCPDPYSTATTSSLKESLLSDAHSICSGSLDGSSSSVGAAGELPGREWDGLGSLLFDDEVLGLGNASGIGLGRAGADLELGYG